VVGGGLSGLAAAARLVALGHEVDVYERSRLLGGKATSFTVDDVEVDNGQHVFLACNDQFIDFITGLGMAVTSSKDSPIYLQPAFDALLLSPSGSARLQESALPGLLRFLPSMLRFSQLGVAGRMQLALALLRTRSARPGENFDSWLRRHRQGPQVRDAFWDPFVIPALNALPREVSARDALLVVRTAFLCGRGAARFGYTKVPLARIAQAASSLVGKVCLRAAVHGVAVESASTGAPRVTIQLREGQTRDYDAAVLAVPPNRLKALVESPQSLGILGLDQFRYAPIVDVHLWFDVPARSLMESEFAAIIGSPVQWVFEKAAPSGESYLCCSMSAAAEYVSRPTAELVAFCHSELRKVMPRLPGAQLIRGAATKDAEATFVPAPGLLRPGPETAVRNVVIAGAWTDTGLPATMESAVRSGRQAAATLHTNLMDMAAA
jgi:squalene-associated FAD-dependent desaturase